MRISDWSSDVCSSDLAAISDTREPAEPAASAVGPRSSVRISLISTRACSASSLSPSKLMSNAPQFGLSQSSPRRPPATSPCASSGRSEEHTSELQSLMRISYAVFCLKKKNKEADSNTREEIKTRKKECHQYL